MMHWSSVFFLLKRGHSMKNLPQIYKTGYPLPMNFKICEFVGSLKTVQSDSLFTAFFCLNWAHNASTSQYNTCAIKAQALSCIFLFYLG